MRTKYLNLFRTIYFISFFALGVFLPYINLWLEQVHHFNGVQIGMINALSILVGISISPLFGYWCDISQKAKKIVILIYLMMLILLQIYMRSTTYVIVLIMACLFEIFKSSAYPIMDSITSNYIKSHNISFGIIRMFGSLGYMLGSMFVGMYLDTLGFNGSLFTSSSIAISLVVILLFYIPNTHQKTKTKNQINFLNILKNKNFYVIFIYIIFSTTLVDASNAYISNHLVTTLKADQFYMSIYTFVMVFPELIFLPFSLYFIHKFGYQKFYKFSAILIFIRLLMIAVLNNPIFIVIMPVTHFTSIMVSAVGNIHFFQQKFASNQMASVLTLLTACVGVIRAVYNFILGLIYNYFSSNVLFMTCAILSVIAIIVISKTTIFDDK